MSYDAIVWSNIQNITDSFAFEYDRVHQPRYSKRRLMSRTSDSEYHYSYYPIPESDEVIQVKLKRSSNCTAFKTWEACFAFLEWVLDHQGIFLFFHSDFNIRTISL